MGLALSLAPVLRLRTVDTVARRRAALTTDASGLAVAAILMQSEFDDEPESHPSPSINWRTVGESRN